MISQKKKKRTDYEKRAKDDSTMFLAHSSGYLWTLGCFLNRCLGFNWIGFLLASFFVFLVHIMRYCIYFFFLIHLPRRRKNHINFTCAHMSICGISKLSSFFWLLERHKGSQTLNHTQTFQVSPI